MEDAEKLSLLGLECIIGYLDANKRILLSLCFNHFRHFEKRVPIRFEQLFMYSTEIVINELDFTFKEVDKLDNVSALSVKTVEKRRGDLFGYQDRGWVSLYDDVPEPGDVTVIKYNSFVLEQQKEVKLQELRHIFMGLLETFLTSAEGVNPMEIFERHITEDRQRWHMQFSKMFEEIRGFRSSGINRLYYEHPLANYDVAVEDELTELYPNAFQLMKSRIEELTVLGDVRSTALKRLAYAPVIVPYFNQFGISRWRPLRPIYDHCLPEGLSLRRALKQFSTVILGGRKHIQCRFFLLMGSGIIPLPVGLKFECEEIPYNILTKTGLFMSQYSRDVNELKEVTISMHLRNIEFVNPLMVKKSNNSGYLESPIKKTLQVGIRNSSVNHCFTIIEEWCKGEHQTIGSKLMIICNFDSSVPEPQIPRISPEMLNSDRFLEMGFRRNQRNQSLFLQKSENTRVELTVQQDMNLFSSKFACVYNVENFFHLEIIDSNWSI